MAFFRVLLIAISLSFGIASVTASEAEFNEAVAEFNAKKYKAALPKFKKLADSGHAKAASYLGDHFFYGVGTKKDYAQSLKYFKIAAEKGGAYSQYFVGYFYQNAPGDLIHIDNKKAFSWFKKAAEQGDAKAQHEVAEALQIGSGVSMDRTASTEWYKKAAAQDHSGAQYVLGLYYLNGVGGLSKNKGKAKELFKKSADSGNEWAKKKLKTLN